MSTIKVRILLSLLLVSIIVMKVNAQIKGHLTQKVNMEAINDIASKIDDWRETKREIWLNSFNRLPDSIKLKLVSEGEKLLSYNWPSHKAMDFLGYKLNGNRTIYESALNQRRQFFENLVKAELIERKGRFIPDIINGLWLILEESTWVSPAHLPYQKLGIGLPNIEDPYIDLGAGRQSVSIAIVYFLLKDEFDEFSKHINVRILHELHRRIIDLYIERTDYWWMGYNSKSINNWNIWINTNVLKTLLLVEQDKDKLRRGIEKIIESADRFVDFYPEDGACDEGPSYWMHAGGELGSMMKWIQDVSFGKVSFKNINKLSNIGRYILNTNITDNVYVNFADAFAIENVNPVKVWNYYNLFKDDDFGIFSKYLATNPEFVEENQGLHDLLEFSIYRGDILSQNEYNRSTKFHFYESLGQVLISNRIDNGTLFFSAIGGNNGVSHNHNDVGSFMVYFDGKPVLIDIGVGVYNSKTFSNKRYEIWNMQSQFHNLPIINSVQQKDGKNFAAKNVIAKEGVQFYNYSLNIASAYPDEAAVESWYRDFKLMKKSNILAVEEKYVLKQDSKEQRIVFMTKYKPSVLNNSFAISMDSNAKAVLNFKSIPKDIKVEEILIDDKRLERVWGDKLYRVIAEFETKDKKGSIKYNLNFSR